MHNTMHLPASLFVLVLVACGSPPLVPTPTPVPTPVPTAIPPTLAPSPVPATATTAPVSSGAYFNLMSDQPIVPWGKTGAWDSPYTDPGAVLHHNGKFHMLRNGFTGWPAAVDIGYVSSIDGVTWTKENDDNPVLRTQDVPYAGLAALASSMLVEPDGSWVLYFYTWENRSNPSKGGVGRATAKQPTGPWIVDKALVLNPGAVGSWDSQQVMAPHVIKTGASYVMYYTGNDGGGLQQIGRATSADGKAWTKHSDPVLKPDAGKWDGGWVNQPRVMPMGTGWIMIYRATERVRTPTMKLGVASSTDGINWARDSANPVFKPEDVPGSTDFWFTNALLHDGRYYLFVEAGFNQSRTQIYLATRKA